MSADGRGDIAPLVERIRASQPRTPAEVREQLNLIEHLVAQLSPQDDYEAAILEALNEMNQALQNVVDNGVTQPPGDGQPMEPIEPLPEDVVPLLQGANLRLEEIVQGIVDTSQLPVGLQGTATVDIPNGSEGVATFDFSGGRYAATVEADESIGQFERVRVKGEGNLVTPVPTQESGQESNDEAIERAQRYDVSVDSSTENILVQPIKPLTDHSSIRVGVSLDTATTFSVRVIPGDDDVAAFTEDLNRGSNLTANAKREFQFDADGAAEYTFRAGTSCTVQNIRVTEVRVL